MNTTTNSIFNSNFSTSNPFNMNGQTSTQDLENSIMQSYAKLEALKAKQNKLQATQMSSQQHTVFTDIASEFD
jgi:hypothetical protein